jgi:hypothetical protein
MPFKPGQSGNPGGKPKLSTRLKKLSGIQLLQDQDYKGFETNLDQHFVFQSPKDASIANRVTSDVLCSSAEEKAQ